MSTICLAICCWSEARDKTVGTSTNCSVICGRRKSRSTKRCWILSCEILGTSVTCSGNAVSRTPTDDSPSAAQEHRESARRDRRCCWVVGLLGCWLFWTHVNEMRSHTSTKHLLLFWTLHYVCVFRLHIRMQAAKLIQNRAQPGDVGVRMPQMASANPGPVLNRSKSLTFLMHTPCVGIRTATTQVVTNPEALSNTWPHAESPNYHVLRGVQEFFHLH